MKYLNASLPTNCDWRIQIKLIASAMEILGAGGWSQVHAVNQRAEGH